MAERESQVDRDVTLDVGTESQSDRETDSGSGGRISSRLPFSTKSLAIAFGLSVVGMIVFGLIPLLPFSNVIGIAAAGLIYGLSTDARRYAEMLLVGATTGGLSIFVSNPFAAIAGSMITLVGVGVVAGAIAGGLGHYFGRDLRAGLTRDLHEDS